VHTESQANVGGSLFCCRIYGEEASILEERPGDRIRAQLG
jgi:hypothetical protein